MSVEDFMKSPLVRWVQLLRPETVTYADICDGVVLGEVMQQIDPRTNLSEMNLSVADFKDRLQNWDILISTVLTYYQNVLQQLILMKLPDVITICKLPFSDAARHEMERTLLLILGCAIQCEQKQLIIEKIKSLDITDQESIMHLIKEVKDSPGKVLPVESLAEKLGGTWTSALYNNILQLLKERLENRSQIQEVTLALEELKKENQRTEPTSSTEFGLAGSSGKTKNSPGTAGLLRRLHLELDEKMAENQELHEELERMTQTAEKLRTENLDLVKEASAARAYRDELDIVQEKANLAKKYEVENTKLREKLNELDFLRARVKELSFENALLLEAKLEMEEELSVSQKRVKAMVELEEQLTQCKRHLETVSAERDSDRQKMLELAEENAGLILDKMSSHSQNIVLEEELKSARMSFNSENSTSLAEQLSEKTTSRLLRLELENQELRQQMMTIQGDDIPSKDVLRLQELEKENAQLGTILRALEQAIAEGTKKELLNCEHLVLKVDINSSRHIMNEDQLQEIKKDNEFERSKMENILGSSHHQHLENGNWNEASESEHTQLSWTKLGLDHRQPQGECESLSSGSSLMIEALEQEKKELFAENERLTNKIMKLQLVYEKYAEAEKALVELQVENEKLSRKLAGTDALMVRITGAEQENTRLKIEVECLHLTIESLKNSSSKIATLEHEKEILNHQIMQLQNSLEATKIDRLALTSLEHDLSTAVDEKLQLKRHLDSIMMNLKILQESQSQLESENGQLLKSLESLEAASKKFDHIQHENDTLEAENQSLLMEKSAADRENTRLRQLLADRKRTVEGLSGKLAELDATNKQLTRKLDRNQLSGDGSQEISPNKPDLEKERQECEEFFTHVTKTTASSLVPVQVVAPSRTGASNSSLNSTIDSEDRQEMEIVQLEDCEGTQRSNGGINQMNDAAADLSESITANVGVVKNDVIRLERKNAVLEGENQNLKGIQIELQKKLEEEERQNALILKELSSAHGQRIAFQTQLERFHAESLALAPKNALLKSQNTALQQECMKLKSRLSQILDDEQELSMVNIRLEEALVTAHRQLKQLAAKHTELQNEHTKLGFDYAELGKEQAELRDEFADLEYKHGKLEDEQAELIKKYALLENEHSVLILDLRKSTEQANHSCDRCLVLRKELDELMQWKAGKESHDTNDNSAELAKANSEIIQLQEEVAEEKKLYGKLQMENRRTREELAGTTLKLREREKHVTVLHEKLNEADKENSSLATKCETMSRFQLRQEDENHALMVQLQTLMVQNQDLLTQILSGKDHYAEEQKSYLNQLSELRRQKEKLEEKIIEQYKLNAKKRNKGFSAFVKRTFLKDKKSKERNKSMIGLDLMSSSDHSLETTPRQSLGGEGLSIKNETFSSRMNSGDNRMQEEKLVLVTSKPKLSLGAEPHDEQITLTQFLEECNRTPKARKKLLEEKKVDVEHEVIPNIKGKYRHRSSHQTLAHPQNFQLDDNAAKMRLFKSELNLPQVSSMSPASEINSGDLDSISTISSPRSEIHDSEKELSPKEMNQKFEFSRVASSEKAVGKPLETEKKPMQYPSNPKDKSCDKSVTLQDSRTSFSSGQSSVVSYDSSKHHYSSVSTPTSYSSEPPSHLHLKNVPVVNKSRTLKDRPLPGSEKVLHDNEYYIQHQSSICTSVSNAELEGRNHSSLSKTTKHRPIPFIDELDHDEVTWRESNVCI